jgi:hypothetical protein
MCFKRLIKKMAILDHFLFNSDYPTDKIVFATKETATIKSGGASNPTYFVINTGIKTQLYTEGDFKIEGSDAFYPLLPQNGLRPPIMGNTTSSMINGECWVGAYLFDWSGGEYAGKKVEMRLWAYCDEKDGENADIGATTNMFTPKLALTSDENYPKYIGSGFLNYGDVYYHRLGYIPLVKIWTHQVNVPIEPGVTGDAYYNAGFGYFGYPDVSRHSIDELIQVTNDRITTYYDPSQTGYDGIYYRMYSL